MRMAGAALASIAFWGCASAVKETEPAEVVPAPGLQGTWSLVNNPATSMTFTSDRFIIGDGEEDFGNREGGWDVSGDRFTWKAWDRYSETIVTQEGQLIWGNDEHARVILPCLGYDCDEAETQEWARTDLTLTLELVVGEWHFPGFPGEDGIDLVINADEFTWTAGSRWLRSSQLTWDQERYALRIAMATSPAGPAFPELDSELDFAFAPLPGGAIQVSVYFTEPSFAALGIHTTPFGGYHRRFVRVNP